MTTIPTTEALARVFAEHGDCYLYRALEWAYRGGVSEVDWDAIATIPPNARPCPPLPDDDGDDIEHLGSIIRNGHALALVSTPTFDF